MRSKCTSATASLGHRSRKSPSHTGLLSEEEYRRIFSEATGIYGTTLEYAAWTVGLGAAIITGLGRWSMVPPPLPPPPPFPAEPAVEPSGIL